MKGLKQFWGFALSRLAQTRPPHGLSPSQTASTPRCAINSLHSRQLHCVPSLGKGAFMPRLGLMCVKNATTATQSEHHRRKWISGVMQQWRSAWTDAQGYTHFKPSGGLGGDRGGGHYSRFFSTNGKLVMGGVAAGMLAVYLSALETVPYTGRRHAILLVSQNQERVMGQTIFDMERQKAAAQHALLPPHHPYVEVVRRVGLKVAAVAEDGYGGGQYSHMKGIEWDFAVVNSPTPNAFVVPGGKVVVYTGLLSMLKSEEELAAVLAHETAHVLARHHAERISSMNIFTVARFAFYALFGFGLPHGAMVLGIFLPYSRRAEYEADAIGLRLMARACFDPIACTTMLAKLHAKEMAMEGAGGKGIPEILRTHPLTDARVEKVRAELPEAYKLYNESRCGLRKGYLDASMIGLETTYL